MLRPVPNPWRDALMYLYAGTIVVAGLLILLLA